MFGGSLIGLNPYVTSSGGSWLTKASARTSDAAISRAVGTAASDSALRHFDASPIWTLRSGLDIYVDELAPEFNDAMGQDPSDANVG